MGLKKQLDVFAEFCRSEETANELSEQELFDVIEAVETLKNVAQKIGHK